MKNIYIILKKMKNFINSIKENKTRLFLVFIIMSWLIISVLLKNYAILIPFIFFLLSTMIMRKPSKLVLVLTILISIIFFNPSPNAYIHMITSTISTVHHPKKPFRLIVEPNSGKEVLPHQVLKMLDMIEENEIDEYQLSSKFEMDILIKQRIVESAWPIKLDGKSNYFFIYEEELDDYLSCSIIDQRESIYLVNCN
jgi:hypothetical protein